MRVCVLISPGVGNKDQMAALSLIATLDAACRPSRDVSPTAREASGVCGAPQLDNAASC